MTSKTNENVRSILNTKWTNDYFFIKDNNIAVCLICHPKISAVKKFSLKRHYK